MKIFILLFAIAQIVQQYAPENLCGGKNSYLVIHFQDYFNNDNVSLKINGNIVFENIMLTSDNTSGYTDFCIEIGKERKHNFFIKHANKIQRYTTREKILIITVIVNKHENKYYVNPFKGKFIGFNKISDSSLYMSQSRIAFKYQ
jgi:hypothetical protein